MGDIQKESTTFSRTKKNKGLQARPFFYSFINMKCTKKPLQNVYQTGREMARLVREYWRDLGAWLNVPFCQFYTHVCALPYIDDPENVETISRPAYLLEPRYTPRDCDDKAILCACWWHGHGVQCRFVASSTEPDKQLHHVFLQIAGGLLIDATFPENSKDIGFYPYFQNLTELKPLTGWF